MLSSVDLGFIALLFAGLGKTLPSLQNSKHVIHEEITHPMAQNKRASPSPETTIPMRIGLRQGNLHKGHDLLMEISDPDSPNFGKRYSMDEVTNMFAPSSETVVEVKAWIIDAGIPAHRVSQSVNKQWIQFEASVGEADRLLRTEHSVYQSHDDDKLFIATNRYHVPHAVQEHIDYITPGVKGLVIGREVSFDRDSTQRADRERQQRADTKIQVGKRGDTSPAEQDCSHGVTPRCINTLYNLTSSDLDTPSAEGNELGIFGMLGVAYTQSNMDTFNQLFVPERNIPVGFGPTVDQIDGAVFITNESFPYASGEANLDFQVAFPIVYPQKTILYIADNPLAVLAMDGTRNTSKTFGQYNTFLDAIDGSYCSQLEPEDPVYPETSNSMYAYHSQLQCGVYKPTNVISISYNVDEHTPLRLSLPARYQIRQCNEFLKLGLQGVTFVVASGDYGVSMQPSFLGPNHDIFSPGYPTNCPYVLSVGGTTVPANKSYTPGNEVAATFGRFGGGSGSGFSNIYDRPSYQKDAVETYFNNYVPDYPYYSSHNNDSFGANGGIYNRNGRGYPDVSAIGQNVAVYYRGKTDTEDGTSAAAPIWAAMITKINDMRINAGKGPVGFINPILYQHPEIFNDIVEGESSGNGGGENGKKGFPASPGWDPVTGLGTPKFDVLKEVLFNLP